MSEQSGTPQTSRGSRGMDGEFGSSPSSLYVMGMSLLLLSLTILFAASMVGYVIVRLRAPVWPPAGTPPLPWGLWISTVILLGCSLTIHLALNHARENRQAGLRRMMLAATLLGAAFLVLQALNWIDLIAAQMTIRHSLYAFTFYTLTGLHALHVMAGVGQLAFVTRRAWAGAYGPSQHIGVTLSAMYWHFLDLVWIVMFACLLMLS